MKFALIVALATVVAVSSYTPTLHSAVFKPGEEYVYHYKGQVLSGIPKSSKQFAGLLIDSLVLIQFQQDYRVVMKMEKIKLFKINNKITTLPSELIPESELTRLTGEQAAILSEFLVKPIKFRYEEGEIKEIEKETSDKYWSINIKKGILSLFQVTLKEKNPFSTSSESSLYSDPTMTRIKSYGSRSRSEYGSMTPYWKLGGKTNSVYKVMETHVTGNCETKYTVISDKEHVATSTSKLHVTAVRNFENCLSKPFYIQGLFQGVYRYPTEKDILQPTVHTDYVITGDHTHFLIKEATLRGKYFFLINGLEGGDLSTFIMQRLVLKTTEPISTPIHVVSPKIDVHGLLMVIPKSTIVPTKKSYDDVFEPIRSRSYEPRRSVYREKYPMRRGLEEMEEEEEEERPFIGERPFDEETPFVGEMGGNIVTVVEEKLSELIKCLYTTTTTDRKCSDLLLDISLILRQTTDKEVVKTLVMRYVRGELSGSSETEYRKAEILLDILPTLPSPDKIKIMLELIREHKISPLRASLMVKTMSLLVKPTPMIIKSTLELYKELPKERSSTLSTKTLLHQALLLSVGTMTHRLINVMRSHSKPIPEVISFIDSISTEMKRMLLETTSESEKILILKSIGNMGASETIMTLKNIVEDIRQPIKIRINAVFALRRLAKQFNKQVVPILLSVFMDVKEIRELRQAAFVVIINANPSYSTLQMISHRIRHETSSQIRSLVYSSLINLASYTSHQPEHKTLVKNARLILKTIPPVRVGVHDTMSVFINKFSEKYDLGGALNVMKIKSKRSGLPEAIIANLQGTLFGKHRKLLEVGAEGKSLEVILRKLFGPYGLFKEILKGKVSIGDILKPFTKPDMGNVGHKIREIMNRMMGELRTEEDPFGGWYIHLLGNEIQYIVLNSQNVEEVVNKVTTIIPELLMKLTRGVKIDVIKALSNVASLTIASPLGIPLSLNVTTMALFKVDGHVKVNNLPGWSEMLSTYYRYPVPELPKISVDVDIKPHIDIREEVLLGADLRWIKSAVGGVVKVRANKPIKFNVHLNSPEHLVSIKYFVPKETVKMLHVTAKPITVIKYVPTTVHKLPFIKEKKVITGEHIVKVTPFEYKYPCTLTGVELETKGTYSLCGPTWCPIIPFFGKQEIMITSRPISSVDYINIKIKSLRTNFQFEGVPSSYATEEMFEKDEEELERERSFYSGRNYRTSTRSLIESGEFEPITTDPIFKGEPIKRQLLITVGPNNLQSPKIKTLITWLMSRGYWENQLNVQVIRLSHGETPAWKIVLNNVVNPLFWHPEETRFRGEVGEFLTKTHLTWDIYGHVMEVKAKIIPGSIIDFTRELREHSIITPDTLPEAMAQKYKYTLDVEFPQMTHRMKKFITIIHNFIKHKLYNKLTTVIPTTPHPNRIIVAVELLPWWEKMNVIVKTPMEDSIISSIPFYWNPFMPTSEKIRMHDVPAWNWYENSTESESIYFKHTVPYTTSSFFNHHVPYTMSSVVPNECVLSPYGITTFDGVQLPGQVGSNFWKQRCTTVLAQHCSDEGLFSMTAEGSVDNVMMMTYMPKLEVKTVFHTDRLASLIVNGNEKMLRTSEPIIIRNEFSETSPILYVIEKLEGDEVVIKAHELGLTIKINPTKRMTKIKLSPLSMLQGQVCGACGNFDQDQSNDYNVIGDFSPENRKYNDYLRPNVLSSETCDVEKIRNEPEELCLIKTHLTIPRYEDGVEMTCSTERKIPQCSEGCRPETTKSIKTCFTCRSETGYSMPRKTYAPPRWDIDESGESCEEFYQRIEVPTSCVQVY